MAWWGWGRKLCNVEMVININRLVFLLAMKKQKYSKLTLKYEERQVNVSSPLVHPFPIAEQLPGQPIEWKGVME
jgi:hypothetical protein